MIHDKSKTSPLTSKCSGLAGKALGCNPQKTKFYFIAKDKPTCLVEYDSSSNNTQEFTLLEGDVIQIAANELGEVFTLDKKGTVQKVTTASKAVTKFSVPDSNLR